MEKFNASQHNSKDPLKKESSSPPAARKLYEAYSKASHNFPGDAIEQAALNMIMNVMRQGFATRAAAEKRWDNVMGKAKAFFLDNHYHGDGSRRNIFPFTQDISVPFLGKLDKH